MFNQHIFLRETFLREQTGKLVPVSVGGVSVCYRSSEEGVGPSVMNRFVLTYEE